MGGLLIFDGDCAFCSGSAAFARRWINADIETLAWQRADLTALRLSVTSCREAVQYRDTLGRWHSAGRAVTALLRESRLPWSALGWLAGLPGLATVVDRCYHWVAAHRYQLPGGTAACRLPEPGP